MTVKARVAVVGDTGPLLCAGALGQREGLNLLYRRFAGRIFVPRAVQHELRGLQGRSGPVGRAATLAVGRKASFLQIDSTEWFEAERRSVRQSVLEVEQTRAGRSGRAAKTDGHGGEVDAILLAEKLGAIMLTNDLAARSVASKRGIATATFASVVAAEIADGDLDAAVGASMCSSLDPYVFYTGLKDPSAQTLAGLRVPSGL